MTKEERPIIVYYSGTGQTKRLVDKINNDSFEVMRMKTGNEIVEQPYILITPTYMKGEIPKQVQKFISNNHAPKEVIGTGNKQWGEHFCGASKKIAEMFSIPLVAKIEQAGHFNEVNTIKEYFTTEYKVSY
ncbi:ribonucleotide reduction protein [Staphylococcus phage Twort]|uniref:Ribonucleotide reduction protein n=2 Tax=Staphylococcus phage Twort (strain DSM 17442 / HER 48) TaxID=2908167 RepID=A0A6H0X5E1_BPTWO|nr:flavodoxin [Staphylococcus phage Twort]AAX92393.1 ORF099 [Staphylococcus phage Twort]QIW89138.1 ribonucleotide reduction protein [Staphylococcus phage Twort]